MDNLVETAPDDLLHAKLALAIAAIADAGVNASHWADTLDPYMFCADITTSRRIAAFLGQVAVETGGFTALVEDLNYSAEGLMAEWPTRFDATTAAQFARRPEAIANLVYANRMGNGTVASGDGWTYRGRGLLQITGKAAYLHAAAGLVVGSADIADYMATDQGAAACSCWYWGTIAANPLADAWEITALSRRINGGDTGLADRIAASNKALAVFGA